MFSLALTDRLLCNKRLLSNLWEIFFKDETYVTITTEHLDTDDQRSFTNSRSMQESTSFMNVERTSTTVAKAGKRQQTLDQVGQQIGKKFLIIFSSTCYCLTFLLQILLKMGILGFNKKVVLKYFSNQTSDLKFIKLFK